MLLLFSRTAAACGHSEYENMESDVPDASTDDEGLSNIRGDNQEVKNTTSGDRSEGWKDIHIQNQSIGRSSQKTAEHPTDDEDDVRSFEEEERRMAQELSATEVERTDKSSGPPLPVSLACQTEHLL